MFGLGFSEMLVIMLVALVAIGPKRLPGVAKALGRGIAEFRSAMDEMRSTVYKEVHEPLKKGLGEQAPTKELKETSAEYLDRLLAQREKERAETQARADEAYAETSASDAQKSEAPSEAAPEAPKPDAPAAKSDTESKA